MKPTKCDEGQVNQTFYLGVRGQTEGKFRDLGLNIYTMGMSRAVADVPLLLRGPGGGSRFDPSWKFILCCFLIEGNDFYQLLFTS